MAETTYKRLLSFFINSSGYLMPYPRNEVVVVSKTMHPYLLGKRGIYHFYNLEKALHGIRASLEALKNVVSQSGNILLVSESSEVKLLFSGYPNLNSLKWKRGALAKSKKADLIFLTQTEKENLVEIHRKNALLVGVGSSTMSKMVYPFNLNIEDPLLSKWFFNSLSLACVRGIKTKGSSNLRKKRSSILLGKGKEKKATSSKSIVNEI